MLLSDLPKAGRAAAAGRLSEAARAVACRTACATKSLQINYGTFPCTPCNKQGSTRCCRASTSSKLITNTIVALSVYQKQTSSKFSAVPLVWKPPLSLAFFSSSRWW